MTAYPYVTSPTVWCLFLGCLMATYLLTPLVIRFALRIGAVDVGGHRKVYQGRPMPLMGGFAIAIPFIAVCLAGRLGPTEMFRMVVDKEMGLLTLALGAAAIVVLGAVDDYYGLRAKHKMLMQVLVALFVCLAGHGLQAIELPLVGVVHFHPLAGTLLTVLWIVGLTNAYNLVDGIDGLAAGLALIGAAGLAVLSAMNGATFSTLLCMALAGSLLAFLRFNFNPARIFLGDTGSMFLGFVLANIALMSSNKSSGTIIFVIPLAMILGLPILDTLTSMIRRYMRGRPIFSGDQGHFHHRLLRRGFSHRKAALTMYAVALAMTVSAIVMFSFPDNSPVLAYSIAGYTLAALGLAWVADYLRPRQAWQLGEIRRRNTMLNAFAKYAALKLNTASGIDAMSPSEVFWMICRELSLSQLEVLREDGSVVVEWSTPTEVREQSPRPLEMKVHFPDGEKLVVHYRYSQPLDEAEQGDFQACLATILEETRSVLPTLATAAVPHKQKARVVGVGT